MAMMVIDVTGCSRGEHARCSIEFVITGIRYGKFRSMKLGQGPSFMERTYDVVAGENLKRCKVALVAFHESAP